MASRPPRLLWSAVGTGVGQQEGVCAVMLEPGAQFVVAPPRRSTLAQCKEDEEASVSEVRRSVGDGFVVEQHVVALTRPDGKSATTDVCVVLRFDDDGLITRLDEYADSAVFASLYS